MARTEVDASCMEALGCNYFTAKGDTNRAHCSDAAAWQSKQQGQNLVRWYLGQAGKITAILWLRFICNRNLGKRRNSVDLA